MSKSVDRVVVFVQENHATDNYFTSLHAWGANVATEWSVGPAELSTVT
jgi:phospholipase C